MSRFVKAKADTSRFFDPVFKVAGAAKVAQAQYGDRVVNASLGMLYNEERQLTAFDSVYGVYNGLSNIQKATYAQSFVGNSDYLQVISQWVLPPLTKYHKVLATPGGSGAIALGFKSFLEPGMSIIVPAIGWTSYEVMATDNQLVADYYQMFDEAGNFTLQPLMAMMTRVIAQQGKVVVVLNDPAQNPTGYSMELSQWQQLVEFINQLPGQVILINDVAYMDFCYDLDQAKQYMRLFDQFKEHVLVLVAYSCSKSLSMYGMRLGAAILIGEETAVEDTMRVFERSARAIWSNVNNAGMVTLATLYQTQWASYLAEKQQYIDLLSKRSKLLMEQCDAVDLPYYPYREGFFLTLRVNDNGLRDRYHNALLENHIYTVLVDQGIRIAICGLTMRQLDGLALKIKTIFNEVDQ